MSKKYQLYIDESGTPDKYISGVNEEHDKFFTLCGVIVEKQEYKKFKKSLQDIKNKYHIYLNNNEIKSNYIRCSNPKFIKKGDEPKYIFYRAENGQKIYDDFCADIRKLIKETDFQIISTTTNKEEAQNDYPHINFHETLLTDFWERISICYVLKGKPKIKILFDRTKSKQDLTLKNTYKTFRDVGSWYWNEQRINNLELDKDVYSCDSIKSAGIQLADLCAYPIKKHMELKNHRFYIDVIKEKIHINAIDKKTGNKVNMGTKMTLSKYR